MEAHLKSQYGFNGFREHQDDIIAGLLRGEDTLAVLPTGGGKSLLYQFPATYSGKTTVVVSPLISLMNDQCAHLNAIGVASACYHSESSDNPGDLSSKAVVYVTPEFVQNRLRILHEKQSCIGLFAIDEAHCVSQWSHDFRTSYLGLGVLKREMPSIPVLAVTATATPRVREDIYTMLEMFEVSEYVLGSRRSNLAISVSAPVNFSTEIHSMSREPTIVYVQTRDACQRMWERLTDEGISCALYHGGLSKQDKEQSHQRFMSGEVAVVVATVAFGMGIDKPDIRNVVNYGVPTDIETYYQEIGRAGRDGLPCRATIYFTEKDFATARFMVSRSDDPQQVALKTRALEMLRAFLADERMCRQQIIEAYFETGEYPHDYTTTDSLPCGICDVCKRAEQAPATDVTNEAIAAYDVVAEQQQKRCTFGVVKTVDIVSARLEGGESKAWLRKVIEAMISMGFLERRAVGGKGNSVVVAGRRNPRQHSPVLIRGVRPRPLGTAPCQSDIEHKVRDVLARRHGVLATNIMNDRVLLNVKTRRPRNVSQLWAIDGISAEFVSRYGNEFIEEYRRLADDAAGSRGKYSDRVQETYRHYRDGKSIAEIAAATGVKARTVEDHVLHIFEHFDEVDIRPAYFGLSTEMETKISDAVTRLGNGRLKPIKEAVGDGVTYAQIKLVLLIRRIESASA